MLFSIFLATITAFFPYTASATEDSNANFDAFFSQLSRTIDQTSHVLSQGHFPIKSQLENLELKDDEDDVFPRATRTATMHLTPQFVGNDEPGPTVIPFYFAYTGKSTTGVSSKLQNWTLSGLDTANSYYMVHGPGCPFVPCGFFTPYNDGGKPLGTNTTLYIGDNAEVGKDFIDKVCVRGPEGLCVDNTTVVSLFRGSALAFGEVNLGLSYGIITPPPQMNNSKDNVPEKTSFLSSLMKQRSLAANEFSISYGAAPEFKLGGTNSAKYQAPLSTFPVMPVGPSNPGYWQLELQGLTVGAPGSSSNHLVANTGGVAIIDSLAPSIVGPRVEVESALRAVSQKFNVKFDHANVTTHGKQNVTIYLVHCHDMSSWDLGLQFGKQAFPFPTSNLNLGRNDLDILDVAGLDNGLKRDVQSTIPGDLCILGIAGYDFHLPGDSSKPVYVVGFPFLREYYSVYSFENGGTVGLAKDIGQ